jgi:hypothetical protein
MNISNIITPKYSIPVNTSSVTPSSGNNVRVIDANNTMIAWQLDGFAYHLSQGGDQKALAAQLAALIGNPNHPSTKSLFTDLPKDMQNQISTIYNKMLLGTATASELNDLSEILRSIPENVSVGKLVAQEILNIKGQFDSEFPMSKTTLLDILAIVLRDVKPDPSRDPDSLYNHLSEKGKWACDDLIAQIEFALKYPEYLNSDILKTKISVDLSNLWSESWKAKTSAAPASPVAGNARVAGQLAAGRV